MRKNSFVEGTVIATVAIVLVKIMGMLYIIPFYATIGIMGAALYAYAYNIYIIFLDISTAGIPIAMSKIVSEYHTLGMMDAKTRAFRIGRKLIGFIAVSAFILLFVFARSIATLILGNLHGGNTIEDVTFVIRCISFAVLVIPFLSVAKGYLQGHKFIAPSSKSQIIEQFIRIIVILGGTLLALRVFGLSLTTAIGIAVFGATAGGIAALIYITSAIARNKEKLSLDKKYKEDKITNKEIRKKIIRYAIPLIIINTTISIYALADLVLINRTLNYLNFAAIDVEFITTSITAWAPKLYMIIGALATGMSVSIIPTISAAFAANKWDEITNKLNKGMQIILVVSIPMTVGISLLALPIWTIFYGYNVVGAGILSFGIFIALFLNMCIVTTSTLQSLNKFKWIYISTIVGFMLNVILNVPLMLLFNYIGLKAYYGAITSTLIGYTITISIVLISLYKEHHMSYKETFKIFRQILIPTALMIIVVLGIQYLFPLNNHTKLNSILYGGTLSLIGAAVYISIAYKMRILENIFGKEHLNKIIKKLTFGKIS